MELVENFLESLKEPEKQNDVVMYMGQVPIFNKLDHDQLLAIATSSEVRVYQPREVVFAQDSSESGLHVVLEGTTLLIRKLPSGSARLIKECSQGSSFGEIGFVTGAPRNLSAIAGPKGSLELVVSREKYDKLIEASPQIGFAIYRDLLGSITRRMETLPVYFRNYLMWGYRPPQLPQSMDEAMSQAAIAKSKLLAMAGGAGGLLGGIVFAIVIRQILPPLGGKAWGAILAAAANLALVGAIFGGMAGAYLDNFEDQRLRKSKHPRSCANCRFNVWDEVTGTNDCLYRLEKLFLVTYREGLEFDTYTDCPSFDPLEVTEKIQVAKRDQIDSKD